MTGTTQPRVVVPLMAPLSIRGARVSPVQIAPVHRAWHTVVTMKISVR